MGLLKNFRRGFATNSSSSHSFVYMREPQASSPARTGQDHFQWNDFRLDTVGDKLFYVLASRIGGHWDGVSDSDVAEAMETHGQDFPEFEEADFREAMNSMGVDHESVGTISLEQARDPYLVVFGGNDNGGASELRKEAAEEINWAATEPTWEESKDPSIKERIKSAVREAVASIPSTPAQAKKFHIGRDGGVKACRATKRACPYTTDDHFATREAAEQALAERYA